MFPYGGLSSMFNSIVDASQLYSVPILTIDNTNLTDEDEAETNAAQQYENDSEKSIFSRKIRVFPCERITFSNNFCKLPIIASETFRHLKSEIFQAAKMNGAFVREELLYYATGLLWLRLIDLKAKQGIQALSDAEEDIHMLTQKIEWNVPEPIYMYLSQIGYVENMGVQIYLEVPQLPETVVDGKGGYHMTATVSELTHNLFEEVPSLGIAADIVMLFASDEQRFFYTLRIGKPQGSRFNSNLCGFFPPTRATSSETERRLYEIKRRLHILGITSKEFPETVAGTRFYLRYMRTISDMVGTLATFKNEKVVISKMSAEGGACQTILTRPMPGEDLKIKCAQANVEAVSAHCRSAEQMGTAYFFGFQLYKEQGQGIDLTEQAERWSCIEREPASNICWHMNTDWYGSRNDRRNLPSPMKVDNFRATPIRQHIQLREIIQALRAKRR